MTHQPKGSMCISCGNANASCASRPFASMPVIKTYPDGVKAVKCTGHVHAQASTEKNEALQQVLVAALEEARSAINSMKVEAETAGQGDEQMMLEACETISNEGLQADMAIRAALASAPQPSHTPQADSQPAASVAGPMQFGGCPECGSRSCVARECSRTVSHAAQAIPGVQWQCGPQANGFTAPQADSQPAPVLDRARIREIFMAHGFTVKEGQTDLKQYVYDAADALLRAARAPADSVLEDAARYRFLAAHCRSTPEHWGGRWSIVVEGPAPKSHDSEDDFDAAIDAARAQAKEGDTQ